MNEKLCLLCAIRPPAFSMKYYEAIVTEITKTYFNMTHSHMLNYTMTASFERVSEKEMGLCADCANERLGRQRKRRILVWSFLSVFALSTLGLSLLRGGNDDGPSTAPLITAGILSALSVSGLLVWIVRTRTPADGRAWAPFIRQAMKENREPLLTNDLDALRKGQRILFDESQYERLRKSGFRESRQTYRFFT